MNIYIPLSTGGCACIQVYCRYLITAKQPSALRANLSPNDCVSTFVMRSGRRDAFFHSTALCSIVDDSFWVVVSKWCSSDFSDCERTPG